MRSTDEIKKHLREGAHSRTTAETRMNKVHCTLMVTTVCSITKTNVSLAFGCDRRVAAAMQYSTLLSNMLCMMVRVRVLSPLPNSDLLILLDLKGSFCYINLLTLKMATAVRLQVLHSIFSSISYIYLL